MSYAPPIPPSSRDDIPAPHDGEPWITDIHLRQLQTIHVFLALGVIVFAGVVGFMLLQAAGEATLPEEGRVRGARVLLRTLALMAAMAYPLAGVIFRRTLRWRRGTAPAWATVQNAYVVRLALYEAVAFFGLVIGLLTSTSGVLAHHPVFWLAAAPTLLLLFLIVATFPTRDRLDALREEGSL